MTYKYDPFQHCCSTMNEHLDPEIKDRGELVEYDRSIRSYSFILRENNKDLGIRQKLIYCPWCGTKLPEDLFDKFEEIIEKEYGLTVSEVNGGAVIPPEFETDEWWKKRGL